METSLFDIKAMQKKGMASSGHAVDYIVGALVVVLLVAVFAQTIFGYLGGGATGLGNKTANPDAPVWLSPILIIVVGVGFLYLILRAVGVAK